MKTKIEIKQIVTILAVVTLLGAFIVGQAPKTNSIEAYLPDVSDNCYSYKLSRFVAPSSYIFKYLDVNGKTAGYLTLTEGTGYGGKLLVEIEWSLDGTIQSLSVPRQQESDAWWDKLNRYKYLDQYIGRQFDEGLILGDDIDAVTGATISSNGVALGVYQGRALLADELGEPYPVPVETIKFGIGEILLISGLIMTVLFRTVATLQKRKWLRYITLGLGLVVLGFWLARPLSLTNIAAWLIGSPPNLATNLFLYILVLGIVGLALFTGKNFYCFWLCPFSAVQELTNRIGGQIGLRPKPKIHKFLRNIRFLLLWAALMLVFWFTNPSLAVFEPWGTLFGQVGTYDQWLLLIITVAFSFFIFGPWCFYICPVGAFLDIVIKIRKGGLELCNKFNRIKKKRLAEPKAQL